MDSLLWCCALVTSIRPASLLCRSELSGIGGEIPLTLTSTGGSVVEFSPATREARVRFPAGAIIIFFFNFSVFSFHFSSTTKEILLFF